MKAVFKYELFKEKSTDDKVDVFLPEGSEILSVQLHEGTIFMWALHDIPVKNVILRRFELFGTGWRIIDKNRKHLATCITPAGFVWHIFENLEN